MQNLIPYGQLKNVFTGETLDNSTTDAYNQFTTEYNATSQEDKRDFLLDQRHRFIVSVSYQNKACQ